MQEISAENAALDFVDFAARYPAWDYALRRVFNSCAQESGGRRAPSGDLQLSACKPCFSTEVASFTLARGRPCADNLSRL